jgi:hypothetical protein
MTERRKYHVYEEARESLFDPAKRRARQEMEAITGAIMNIEFANWLKSAGVKPTKNTDSQPS